MKKVSMIVALAFLAAALALAAGEAKKEKVISGTVSRLDTANRSLTVTDAQGTTWSVQWSDSTRVLGGELKDGAAVQLGVSRSEKQHRANWIKVTEAK